MINFRKFFNYPIYEVGGCVRDSILGLPIKDTDIASDLPPEEFKKLCKKLGCKTHDTGIDHGTVTVIIDGECYEHTTFRKDVSCDGRNATIEFSKTIEEDLSRRDFTINAIAKLGDEIIDPFHGQEDLKNRKLKTVGDAEERFSEDYLRIVRAARFISRLKLKADSKLVKAANKLSCRIIKHVSIERISDEIKKAQKHAKDFFIEAEALGFLFEIFPEASQLSSEEKNSWLNHIQNAESKDEVLYFAAILIPLFGKEAEKKAAFLRMSGHISKGTGILYKTRPLFSENISPSSLRDLMIEAKVYYEDAKEFFCEISNNTEDSRLVIKRIESFENKVKESIQSPFIKGEYLIQAGLKPSPAFKSILDDCGRLQAEGKDYAEVESYAKSRIDSLK